MTVGDVVDIGTGVVDVADAELACSAAVDEGIVGTIVTTGAEVISCEELDGVDNSELACWDDVIAIVVPGDDVDGAVGMEHTSVTTPPDTASEYSCGP